MGNAQDHFDILVVIVGGPDVELYIGHDYYHLIIIVFIGTYYKYKFIKFIGVIHSVLFGIVYIIIAHYYF